MFCLFHRDHIEPHSDEREFDAKRMIDVYVMFLTYDKTYKEDSSYKD